MTNHATVKRSARELATKTDVALVDYPDLIARCMGNLAFAEKILGRFEQRFDEDLILLEKELNERDAEGIARVAHKLRGASANVSANGLGDIFARLERLGRTEQFREVSECMDELRSVWPRFKAQTLLFASAGARDEPTVAVD